MDIEQIMDEDQGLQLTEENVEKVLDEIRPYLVGERFPAIPDPHHLPSLKASQHVVWCSARQGKWKIGLHVVS